MASTPEKDLELQLKEAGNKLLNPPSSVEELLPLLDHVESCLSKVEQSPKESMQSALAPSLKALVADNLFMHANSDVKVAVASCISEITRITAPDAPYNDEKMKDVFQLIVSTFENLADSRSRSYCKRTMILETVANVRSCVVMLDLECDALIIQMFQHFLNSIRDYHPENIFSSMETIMSLVLEESEEISVDFLSPLLASVRIDNKDVIPVARKLAEKVISNCASKINPYLDKAVKTLGLPVEKYGKVVSSICSMDTGDATHNEHHETDERKAEDTVLEKPIDGESKSAEKDVSKDDAHETAEDKLAHSKSALKSEDDDKEQVKTSDASMLLEAQSVNDEASADTRCIPEDTEKNKGKKADSSKKQSAPSKSNHVEPENTEKRDAKTEKKSGSESRHKDTSGDSATSSKKKKATDVELPAKRSSGSDSGCMLSATVIKDLTGENRPKKVGRPKKKDSLSKRASSSIENSANKPPDDSFEPEAKPHKHAGKKGSLSPSTPKDVSKKEKILSSKSEGKKAKLAKRKVETGSANGEQSKSSQDEYKKRGNHGKAASEIESNVGTKSAKRDQSAKETPKISRKRERTRESPKIFGSEVVGMKVKVWWPRDRQYYEGKIESFDSVKRKHKVVYTDGDVEILNLKTQKFEFVDSESESGEEVGDDNDHAASEIRAKKKQKTSHGKPNKLEKSESSMKHRGVGSSSSKFKGAKPKAKEPKKADDELLDDLKPRKKADDELLDDLKPRKKPDDHEEKSKDRTPKAAAKSLEKGSSKRKMEEKLSAIGKSKDASKLSKLKQKAKSGKGKHESSTAKGKPNAGEGKHKPNSSKHDDEEKEDEDEDDAEEEEEDDEDEDETPTESESDSEAKNAASGNEKKGGGKKRARE